MNFTKYDYQNLNAKDKELRNFFTIAAALYEYGYASQLLFNDWLGADFEMYHVETGARYSVQLKGRLTFAQKYVGKDLYVAFIHGQDIYIYPHDEVLFKVNPTDKTWTGTGAWSNGRLTKGQAEILAPYKVN